MKIKELIKKNDILTAKLKSYAIRWSKFTSKYTTDEKYIIKQYKHRTGKTLDLENPRTFNEKIQWLKLNYKNPLLHKLVDKYEVREYVSQKIGSKYLVPLYGVYNSIDEIDFDKLPNEFIMKLTNGSSFNYICTEKNEKNIKTIKADFKEWLKTDYYYYGREWAYKDVKNRIVCEKLLKPSNGKPPEDYRFFCFNGKVKAISVDFDSVINGVKNANYKRNIYDSNWNQIDAQIEYPNKENVNLIVTDEMKQMVELAEKLSEELPEVRVDFYYFDKKIYFGELTFYHSSGYQKILPHSFELELGKEIKIC